jgi:hypothetical protein
MKSALFATIVLYVLIISTNTSYYAHCNEHNIVQDLKLFMEQSNSPVVEVAQKLFAHDPTTALGKSFSASSITVSKDFCGARLLNSTLDTSLAFVTSYYTLDYTLKVCDMWDDMDFNNTQILDEISFGNTVFPSTSISIINVSLVPTDDFTANSSCVSVVPLDNATTPTFILLSSNCSSGNSLICNTTTTAFTSANINGIPEQVHPGALGDLPPVSSCHTEPTCCLRYTLSLTVAIVNTNPRTCPAVPITNCAYANASLCGCSLAMLNSVDYKNNKILGKKYSGLSEEKSITLNQQLAKEVLSQCTTTRSACAVSCSNYTIPAPVNNIVLPSALYCSLVTSNLCLCNQGNQSTNCSYSAVQCYLNYTNYGETGVVVEYSIAVVDTTDLGSLPTNINLPSNCNQTAAGSVITYVCNVPSFSSLQVTTQFCYTRYDTSYLTTFTQETTILELCSGGAAPPVTTSGVTIPPQTLALDFIKYAVPGTGFVCPDLSFPSDYNNSVLCQQYIIPVQVVAGCADCTNLLFVDDISQFTSLGAQISDFTAPSPFSCTITDSVISCTCSGTLYPNTTYVFNYTICFCNCNFCNAVPGKVFTVNNTATLDYLSSASIDTVSSLIVCPSFKNCTGCTTSISPVYTAVGDHVRLSVDDTSPNSIPPTYFQGSYCILRCPALNGSTQLALWELTYSSRTGSMSFVVEQTVFNQTNVGGAIVQVYQTCNYTIDCCGIGTPPSIVTNANQCNINGTISAESSTSGCSPIYNSPFNCSLYNCPLVPLPQASNACLNLTTGVDIVSYALSSCCSGVCSSVGMRLNSAQTTHNGKSLVTPYCNVSNGVTGQQVSYTIKNVGTATEDITIKFNGTATSPSGTGAGTDILYPTSLNPVLSTDGWICDFTDVGGVGTCTITGVPSGEKVSIAIDYAFAVQPPPEQIQFQMTATGSAQGISSDITTIYNPSGPCDNTLACMQL